MKRQFLYVELARRLRGLTQTTLSRRTGVSLSNLSLLEGGERVPANVWPKLSLFFGCSAELLQQPVPQSMVPKQLEPDDQMTPPPLPSLRDRLLKGRQ